MGVKNSKSKNSLKKSSKVKTLLKRSILGLTLGFHLTTQVNYCAGENQDSEERTTFEEEFGFPVQGFRENVEDYPGNLSSLALAVYKEKLEKDFDLAAIRISSDTYLKKSIPGQLEHILFKGGEAYDGVTVPYLGRIYLDDTFSSITAHHEIKHVKTDEIMRDNPSFEKEWLALTRDADGNSLYAGFPRWLLSRIRFIGDYVEEEIFSREENERLGFVSSYARLRYYEDIAEVCEEAESSYSVERFIRLLYTERNERIAGKVALAQKYGLIPAEFSEYIRIRKIFEEREELADVTAALLEASDEFLIDHPHSVYQITLRNKRGRLLKRRGRYKEAIEECRLGLTAEYKDKVDYEAILDNISEGYIALGESEKASIYREAKEKYEEGWNANDLTVALHGVNDFLKEKGEEL